MALLDDVLEELNQEPSGQEPGENTGNKETNGADGKPSKPMNSYSPEFEEFAKNNKKES